MEACAWQGKEVGQLGRLFQRVGIGRKASTRVTTPAAAWDSA